MTLDAFKLLFAERPEAPEGVEFWEWVPMQSRAARHQMALEGDYATVPLWKPGGPPEFVILFWPRGERVVEYWVEREGALTA